MKKIYGMALAGLLVASCTGGEKVSVLNGEIEGLENDTVIVFARDMVNGTSLPTDTIPVVSGKFSVQYPDTTIVNLQIIEKPLGNRAFRMVRNSGILLLPGDKVQAKGELDALSLSGSELYDEMNGVESVVAAQKEYTAVENDLMKLYAAQQKDKEQIDSVMTVLKAKASVVNDAKMEYIKANPASITSAYYSLAINAENGVKACQMLAPEVRNGVLKEMIDRAEKGYQNFIAREEAKKNIQPGKPAPNFKLKNLDNEMMTLDSFKGKYVVLDFWGTWCGWCIKGMPRMKEYYAKYKNKVEFVGVNCRDTEDKWRKGVEQHKLPWVNLFNGNDSEIVNKYAVSGFPTKILIDAQGVIVKVFVGESDEMYNKLDELFK